NGKSKKTRKSKDQRTDRFEYAAIDYSTGTAQKKEFKVNSINAKKEDIKKIDVLKIDVVDNQFYVNSTIGKVKPWVYALLLCPPVGCAAITIVPGGKKWTG